MRAEVEMASEVSKVLFEGRTSLFHCNNPEDHIQSFHRRGLFYELRQLEAHRDLIPMQSTILDIGANIGNHTIFYAMHTWAGIVYPFEPNPVARELLLASIRDNSDYRTRLDTKYTNLAVGREPCRLQIGSNPINNLGGTDFIRPAEDGAGTVDCVRLDDLAFEGQVCFLKIDVEGMELDVLAGAEQLIAQTRPAIAIEVASRHEPGFWAWVRSHDYQVVSVYFEYLHFKNFILIPAGRWQ